MLMRDWADSEWDFSIAQGDRRPKHCGGSSLTALATAEKETQAEVPEVQVTGFSLLAWMKAQQTAD